MSSDDAPLSRRDRLRAQTLAEIREHAWAQVDAGGAHALSLNAIAKAMGMSGPALYRYFASRDELLGALVVEGYDDLVQAIATIHRGMVVLLESLGEIAPGGGGSGRAGGRDKLDQQLVRWAQARAMPAGLPTAALRAGVLTWTQLHGIVSLELAGALPAMGLDAGLLVDAALGGV